MSTLIFSGTFETERLLVNTKLEGEWALGDSLAFRPKATAFYLHEKVGDYSVGNRRDEAVILSGFATDQVRLSASGVLEYAMPYGGAFGLLSGGFSLVGDGDWSIQTGIERSAPSA